MFFHSKCLLSLLVLITTDPDSDRDCDCVVHLPVLKVIMAGWPKPAQFLAVISTSYRLSGCNLARVSLWREPEILLDSHSARGSPNWSRDREDELRIRNSQKLPVQHIKLLGKALHF